MFFFFFCWYNASCHNPGRAFTVECECRYLGYQVRTSHAGGLVWVWTMKVMHFLSFQHYSTVSEPTLPFTNRPGGQLKVLAQTGTALQKLNSINQHDRKKQVTGRAPMLTCNQYDKQPKSNKAIHHCKERRITTCSKNKIFVCHWSLLEIRFFFHIMTRRPTYSVVFLILISYSIYCTV